MPENSVMRGQPPLEWEPVIGLEIHAELKTKTKMFCDSLNDSRESQPNVNICPVCMGHPGTLPVPNGEAVRSLLRVGLAVGGTIASESYFERKNYFYPDLPKGYQISQYQRPLVSGGGIDVTQSGGEIRRIRIERIHLEEDTARSIHDPKTKTTLLDFNRSGIPLMELVTEPDMHNPEEVSQFAEELQRTLQYLGASDANMEAGEMRIEVNVSLRPAGSQKLGTKVELKNINSFRFAGKAIGYEIERQAGQLERGEQVVQETRGWDEARGMTVAQRSKEESHDYRYFPEPDIPPFRIAPDLVEELRRSIPELPAAKRRRFHDEFGLAAGIADTLVRDRRLAGFFESAASELRAWLSARGGAAGNLAEPLRLAANYLTTDAAGRIGGTEHRLTPENFAELITYLVEGKVSSRVAKDVLAEMLATGADPSVLIEERGLWQVSRADALASAVADAISSNPKAADDYRSGKGGALQFLVGQAMKTSRGANPETLRALLEEKLK